MKAAQSVSRAAAPKSRRLDKEQRRGEILDAAFTLFATRGYEATRIADIAMQAGIAKGLVLFYFKTKEDVFQAVVRRAIPELLDRLDGHASQAEGSAAQVLRTVLRQVYRFLVDNPQTRVILQLLIAEGHRFPSLKAFYHREVVVRGNAAITKIIALGVEHGEFRETLDENLSRVLLGPLISALFWQILFADLEPIDVERHFETHIDIILHGLLAAQ